MLELRNITKDYKLKDQEVNALKSINLSFRRSEFVSILGPSGCGKTTLLNIIGGLDRYSSGDLIIDGISTKEYKDKDWDNYRNHRVGFVFQSYNLIAHQTVLENVEIALTLSGVKRSERRKRAIEVLEQVGLKDKIKSKPNQLSGGQMQRVAIARALVNNPEIILADEPTGALDSKTSIQIMELLQEISKDRLVIMVTHNPELAETYSTRIVKLLDGNLTEDSKPHVITKNNKTEALKAKETTGFVKTNKKKSMSFLTALSLSFKNLLTKKGRTLMVGFAGSIGIIGIALILAVSSGMTNYINKTQSDSLSSYPIAISTIAVDLSSAPNSLNNAGNAQESSTNNAIDVYNPADIFTSMGEFNYISNEFVDYIKDYYEKEENSRKINALQISYASDMRFITKNSSNRFVPINNPVKISIMSGTTSSVFFEGVNNKDLVLSSYEILGGEQAHYPANKNEVALVVSSNNLSMTELMSMGFDVKFSQPDSNGKVNPLPIEYSNIIGKTYKLIKNDAYYNSITEKPNVNFSLLDGGENGISEFYSNYTQADLENLYNHTATEELTISCILKLKDNAAGSIFSTGIMYTPELAEYYHTDCINSQVVSTLKNKYLQPETDALGQTIYTFKNGGEENFVNTYVVNIKEMSALTDKDLFTYTSPKMMQDSLKQQMAYTLSDEEIIDYYLQFYGASSIPTGVYCYLTNFDAKDDYISLMNMWNKSHALNKIYYSDSSALLSNLLSTLVDTISYVLIAFAGISLVVSSVMISIITYTSVIERTKEIGVLRSVGASKLDISRVFNAETIILGLLSGLLGVILALLLTIPISLILELFTGIAGLATLEVLPAIILVCVSVFITFLAGLVPSYLASKKEPVIALRSE